MQKENIILSITEESKLFSITENSRIIYKPLTIYASWVDSTFFIKMEIPMLWVNEFDIADAIAYTTKFQVDSIAQFLSLLKSEQMNIDENTLNQLLSQISPIFTK